MASLDFVDNKLPVALTNCVRHSVEGIFTTILGSKTTYCHDGDGEMVGHGIVGIISFVGDVSWLLMLVLPKASANSLAAKFTGFEVDYDGPDMGDVVGELANVLAGDMVGRLSVAGIKVAMSLPTIMRGNDVEPLLPRGISADKMFFTSPQGDFWLRLAGSKSSVGADTFRKPGT